MSWVFFIRWLPVIVKRAVFPDFIAPFILEMTFCATLIRFFLVGFPTSRHVFIVYKTLSDIERFETPGIVSNSSCCIHFFFSASRAPLMSGFSRVSFSFFLFYPFEMVFALTISHYHCETKGKPLFVHMKALDI